MVRLKLRARPLGEAGLPDPDELHRQMSRDVESKMASRKPLDLFNEIERELMDALQDLKSSKSNHLSADGQLTRDSFGARLGYKVQHLAKLAKEFQELYKAHALHRVINRKPLK